MGFLRILRKTAKTGAFQIVLITLLFFIVPVSFVFADGEAGFALDFDGVDDYVLLGDTQEIFGGTSWEDTKTVTMWIKPEGEATVCGYNDVAWCDAIFGDRPRWWGISRGIVSGVDRIWVWNKYGAGSLDYDKIGIRYTSGEWIHIAIVHNAGIFSAYKNGELIESVSSGSTDQPSTGALPDLQLGAVINNADRNWSFAGQIDEVRLYDIALTQSEIQNTLFEELVGNEAGLVAYYRMSDGSGLVLSDDRVDALGTPVPAPFDGQLLEWAAVGATPVAPPPQWVSSGAFDQPVSSDQFVSVDEDQSVPFNLYGLDKQNGPLDYILLSTPTKGSLEGTAPDLTYIPEANYFGTDQIVYQVDDGFTTSDIGIILITINSVNDSPTADNKQVSTAINTPVGVPLTGSDVDDLTLTFQLVDYPDHGFFTNNNPNYVYNPFTDYEGADSFTYRAWDGEEYSAVATVTITIGSDVPPPVYENQVFIPLITR